MRRTPNAALLSLLVIAAGCGAGSVARSGAPAEVRASAGSESTAAPGEVCPADLPGLEARSSDIRGGSALVLTANHEHVDELRHRMRRFAREHGDAAAEQARATLARGETFDDSDVMESSTVRVVEVPHGARVEVRPRHVSDLDAVRNEVRAQARDLAEGRCPLALTVGR